MSELSETLHNKDNRRLDAILKIKVSNPPADAIRLLNAAMGIYIEEQQRLICLYGSLPTEEQYFEILEIGQAAALCLTSIVSLEGGVPPVASEVSEYLKETLGNLCHIADKVVIKRAVEATIKIDGSHPDRDDLAFPHFFEFGSEILDRETLVSLLDVLDHFKLY